MGRGACRVPRCRLRRHQLRLPDRLLHAQGAGRVGRTAPQSHPPAGRGDQASVARIPSRRRFGSAGATPIAIICSRRRRRSTAAPMRCSSTAARATRAIASRRTGTAIGEIAAAVPVPVVGNGDLLFPHEIADARKRVRLCRRDGRAGGADQAVDLSRSDERLLGHLGRRAARAVSALCGARPRALGRRRSRARPRPHVYRAGTCDFWCRYVPRHEDGTYPSMQQRASAFDAAIAARSAALTTGSPRRSSF